MKWLGLLGLCLLLGGCVAPTEVKQASSEVGVSINSLRDAQGSFRDAYIREIEETRQIVGRSIVAAAVVRKVDEMSAEQIDGNLIDLSRAIASEREAYRRLVDQVLAATAGPGETPEGVVRRVAVAPRVNALRETAAALQAAGESESATAARARADEMEASNEAIADLADFVVLVELESTKADIEDGLADLDDYLKFLNLIHAQVDAWIATDVRVQGEDVARLLETHADLIGLGAGMPTGGAS